MSKEKSPQDGILTDPPSQLINRAIEKFVDRIEGIKRSEQIVMPLIGAFSKKADEAFAHFLEHEKIERKIEGTKTVFSVPLKNVAKFEELQRKCDSIDSALFQTPRALLVALVSAYDAYLGDLLRATFYLKPELLNASNRSLLFTDLVSLGSVEQAREYLIEKEIESVVRESHSKHFDWMENRFAVPLRKGLECWPTFIELTERRNLFVHTDGVISSQYLEVCRIHDVDVAKLSAGDRLSVTGDYFQNAFQCLYEIGVKLGHVLWRKLAPNDLKGADEALNDVCFELLKSEKYSLASRLLEFSTNTLKKHHSNLVRRMFVVNLAIARKWGGDNQSAMNILDAEDWSDCGDNFKMAVAVLKEEFSEAEEIFRTLGAEAKGIGRVGYETWPLFRDFRKSEHFRNAFKDIYGEDFELKAQTPTEKKESKSDQQPVEQKLDPEKADPPRSESALPIQSKRSTSPTALTRPRVRRAPSVKDGDTSRG